MTRCVLKQNEGRLQVLAPRSGEFDAKAELLAGRWKQRSRIWSFKLTQYPLVRQYCLEVYGHVEGWAPPEDQ